MGWTIDFSDIIRAFFWFAAAVALVSVVVVARAAVLHRKPAVDAARERALLKTANARKFAMQLLRSGDAAAQILAAQTLANFGDRSALPLLQELAHAADPVLSLAAAQAALQIDEDFAAAFVSLTIERRDWSPLRLQAVVEERRSVLAGPIVEAIPGTEPAAVCSLLAYLPLFGRARALPVLRGVLETATDAEVLARALAAIAIAGESEDAMYAAAFRAHEDSRVRVQAANALGHTGDVSHVPLLAKMLDDSNWWVRYRAAQAIARIEGGGTAALLALLEAKQDRYARDMLVQIISEHAPREPQAQS